MSEPARAVDKEVDATIKNAVIVRAGDGSRVAYGEIYADRKGRFRDGATVQTSPIVEGPDSDGLILTRNSTYRLEMFKPGDRLPPPPELDEAAAPAAPKPYADELRACASIASELEQAVREYQAGHPIAARMHLLEVQSQARALWSGEMV